MTAVEVSIDLLRAIPIFAGKGMSEEPFMAIVSEPE
jgi:hypothetical protein